jgi:hypothetical protein
VWLLDIKVLSAIFESSKAKQTKTCGPNDSIFGRREAAHT